MNNPVYETSDDRKNEQSTMEYIATKWGCKPEKMPPFSKIDYAITRNGVVHAMAEVKNRKAETAKYDTLYISMSKVVEAKQYNDQGLPTFLIVRLGDANPIYIDLARTIPEKITWNGRAGRDAPEPVCHFLWSEFKDL